MRVKVISNEPFINLEYLIDGEYKRGDRTKKDKPVYIKDSFYNILGTESKWQLELTAETSAWYNRDWPIRIIILILWLSLEYVLILFTK